MTETENFNNINYLLDHSIKVIKIHIKRHLNNEWENSSKELSKSIIDYYTSIAIYIEFNNIENLSKEKYEEFANILSIAKELYGTACCSVLQDLNINSEAVESED